MSRIRARPSDGLPGRWRIVGAAGAVGGWTASVWAYELALAGATAFGAGPLRDGVAPRSGAVLLAAVPVVLAASFGLAVALGDESLVALGPAATLGAGVAAIGRWVWRDAADR
ncbi:hypothetical protein BRC82_02295 [Halobacteriales archaeon QS_1_67_19]|nr:MAG: hypothetical protein BRC82_02295 [Halobacteriales archaeon QS_1_67_19]